MKTEYKLKFFGDDSGESLKNFIKESASKATSKTFDKFIPSEDKPVVAEDVVKIAAELLYTTPTSKSVGTEEKPVIEIEEPKKQKTILESKFETLQKSLSEDLREYKQKIIEEVSKTTSKPNPYYTLGDSGSGEVRLLNMDDVETKKMSRDTRASILANNETLTYDTRDKKFHFRYALNQDVLKESNVVFNNISTTGNINVSGQVFVTSGVTGNIDLTVSGNTSIGKNLLVSGNTILQGNLLVTGYTTTLNVRNLSVTDALIYLNDSSPVTNVDIGVTGNYNDGSYKHAGIFRDSNDGVWKLFDGYTPELNVATKILTSDSSYVDAALKVGNFTANGSATVATTLSVTGNTTAANFNTVGVANVGNSIITALTANKPVFTDANKKLTSSGTVPTDQGGTGLTSFTANGVVYASSSSALATGSALTFDGASLVGTGKFQSQVMRIKDASFSELYFSTADTGGNGALSYNHSLNALAFYANGSTQMTLTSTGLGIGTSSPGYRLDVVGTGVRLSNSPVGGPTFFLNNTSGTSFKSQITWTSNGTGKWSFGLDPSAAGTNSLFWYDEVASLTRMILDASGNLGLGITPSAWSGVKALQVNSGASLAGDTANLYLNTNAYYNGSNWVYATTNYANRYQAGTGFHAWYNAPSGTAGNAITFTQAMTLDASGNLLVGTTTQTGTFNVTYTGTAQPVSYVYASNSSFTNAVVRASMAGTSTSAQLFLGINSNTSAVFYVNGGGAIYSTSTSITAISDRRLKENIRDLDDGLNAVMALKPRKFDWKAGRGANIKNTRGFIAQEFEQVFPDMIREWLDPAPEGEEPYKAVNADLIPTLVKAIQEQQALIQSLTDRIVQLETK